MRRFDARKKKKEERNDVVLNLHHRRKEWHTAAVGRTQSSPSVRLCSFPRAYVVFVCSAALPPPFVCRSRSRLRSAVVFVQPSSSFAFFAVHVRWAFTVRFPSPFTVRVRIRVRLEATLLCFKLCDQPACSTTVGREFKHREGLGIGFPAGWDLSGSDQSFFPSLDDMGARGVVGDKWSMRILWACALGSAAGLYMVAVERQKKNREKILAEALNMELGESNGKDV
ncbi:hypothetical protein Ahy_A04g020358 [Arachis hypogaea]|uniref:Uncharacterized protein n=2 Tax=Arachis TaxID=3817 RepID=A0A445DHJ3_ARAHY|nr:hypothetical protein Ahy_A04g020358 [Arachis hypogaea]